MKASVSRGAWIVALFCLQTAACFRSLDGTKVRCTSSDHCPSDYVCSAGKCVSRFADAGGLDENGADTEPQPPQPGVDAAPAGDVDNESILDADQADLSSQTTLDLVASSG